MAIEIKRDQLRNYEVDRSSAIETANVAKAIGDTGQVIGAVGTVAKGVGNIRDELAKPDVEEAENNFKEDSARLAKANAERLQNNPNLDASSDDHINWYRGQAEKIFGARDFSGKWEHAKDKYGELSGGYVAEGVAANIRYSAQQKTRAAGTAQAGALKNADMNVNDYYAKMRALGDSGNMSDGQGLTTEALAGIEKSLGDAGTPQQRKRALTEVATRGGMEWTVGLSQKDPELADAIVNSDDAFMKYMPTEFRDNIIEMERQGQIDNWGKQRTIIESELSTTDSRSPRARELQKEIKSLDKKVKDFGDDKDFDAKTIKNAREAFKASVQPAMQSVSWNRSVEGRQAAYQQQQNVMSKGVMTLGPQTEWFLNEQVEKEKLSKNQTKINPATGQAYEMSPANTEKKGQWEGIRDDFVGYRNEMTKISPIVESAPASKAAVNDAFFNLTTMKATDAQGNPTDFQVAAIKFLHGMARAPITESERRDYADMVGGLMLAKDDRIQEIREILQSGDVGVYSKGGLSGSVAYHANDLPFQQSAEIGAAVRLEDERQGSFGRTGIASSEKNLSGGRDLRYKDTGSFDKALRQTQAEYQTRAVNMAVKGATIQDIMNMRKEMFDKSINDWYSNRYVVDLGELDRKLQNKEPAHQGIDGVIYEYKGRDSIGRPLWKDPSVLNTNRDFARINNNYKMEEN